MHYARGLTVIPHTIKCKYLAPICANLERVASNWSREFVYISYTYTHIYMQNISYSFVKFPLHVICIHKAAC